jgi:hypothetical protein
MAQVRLLALACLASVSAAASGQISVIKDHSPVIQGSGRIVRQARPIAAVSSVELAGATNLEVRLGSAPSLTIEADDNLLPLMTSEIQGDTLVIGSRGSYRTNVTPRVYLTVPDLRQVQSTGSGNVLLMGVSNASLTLNIRGSGNMRAIGRTGRLDATIRGSGDFDLEALAVRDARVDVMGSGDATVRVSGALDASAFGSGDVRYFGRPAALAVHTGGTGRIVPIGG